jgi:hypothetical protein
MSSVTSELSNPYLAEGEMPYRALSRGAVFALVLAVLSIPLAFSVAMLVVPLIATVIGLLAWIKIRRYPDELTGAPVAMVSALLGVVVFLGGSARHAWIYAHELKPGYVRTSFSDLQPVRERPELPVSPAAIRLNGKKVFIKGYVYPDGQGDGIKRFVLVPDLGTCCFGGQPKLTDMVEVTLRDPLRVSYSRRRLKLHGILKVDTTLKPVSGLNGVYYQLDVDQVD